MVQRQLLSDLERRQIREYLKRNGERSLGVRVLVTRCRRHVAKIRADLELIESLLETYERSKAKEAAKS